MTIQSSSLLFPLINVIMYGKRENHTKWIHQITNIEICNLVISRGNAVDRMPLQQHKWSIAKQCNRRLPNCPVFRSRHRKTWVDGECFYRQCFIHKDCLAYNFPYPCIFILSLILLAWWFFLPEKVSTLFNMPRCHQTCLQYTLKEIVQ